MSGPTSTPDPRVGSPFRAPALPAQVSGGEVRKGGGAPLRGFGYTTRAFAFSSGHRYWVSEWTDAENHRVFGALTAHHGHNYRLDVTVRGPIDERTGMVMDLAELKRIVGDLVVSRFDHADLNADPFFAGKVPTTENLALVVWRLLAPKLGAERLWRVRVWEDPTLYVDYFGA